MAQQVKVLCKPGDLGLISGAHTKVEKSSHMELSWPPYAHMQYTHTNNKIKILIKGQN